MNYFDDAVAEGMAGLRRNELKQSKIVNFKESVEKQRTFFQGLGPLCGKTFNKSTQNSTYP